MLIVYGAHRRITATAKELNYNDMVEKKKSTDKQLNHRHKYDYRAIY